MNNPLDMALDAIDRFGRYTRATVGTRPFGEPDVTYAPLTFEFSDNFTTCENGARSTDDVVEPPETSATNENGNGALLSRVIAAWGSATATVSLLSNRYQRQWRGAIVAFNDHKGTLEVTWRDEQSRILFEGVIMVPGSGRASIRGRMRWLDAMEQPNMKGPWRATSQRRW